MARKAYSYTRFSTPEQAQGDSARRQLAAAEDYARRHDLDLDDTLTFRDLGVSAYRGRNADDGRLGDFLGAVRGGVVKPGSYLLVENLDRISRQTARKALRTLEAIVEAGVTVVTMTDGKAYTEANLDADPVSLMMALLHFVRAHEESALKGRRLRAAWDNKRRKAETEGTPLTRRTPGWLVLGANGKLRLDPRKARIVRRIFKMTLEGHGQHAIAQALNRAKVKPFNADHWHRSYVKKILENPAVIGRLVAYRIEYENGRKVRNPAVVIDDHFPAVVSVDDWTRVQEMRDVGASSGKRLRASPKGTAPLRNILAGLARCPRCEGTMTRVSKGKDGGYPYLVCARAKAGAGCSYTSVRMEGVEVRVLGALGALLADMPSGDDDADARLTSIEDELEAARERIANVTSAIAERGMAGALAERLRSLEAALTVLEAEHAEALAKIDAGPLQAMKATALRAELEASEPDRARVNALLRQLVRAVVIAYEDGDLVFEWKHGGQSRLSYTIPTPANMLLRPGRRRQL